jgi:hypothetical protein
MGIEYDIVFSIIANNHESCVWKWAGLIPNWPSNDKETRFKFLASAMRLPTTMGNQYQPRAKSWKSRQPRSVTFGTGGHHSPREFGYMGMIIPHANVRVDGLTSLSWILVLGPYSTWAHKGSAWLLWLRTWLGKYDMLIHTQLLGWKLDISNKGKRRDFGNV